MNTELSASNLNASIWGMSTTDALDKALALPSIVLSISVFKSTSPICVEMKWTNRRICHACEAALSWLSCWIILSSSWPIISSRCFSSKLSFSSKTEKFFLSSHCILNNNNAVGQQWKNVLSIGFLNFFTDILHRFLNCYLALWDELSKLFHSINLWIDCFWNTQNVSVLVTPRENVEEDSLFSFQNGFWKKNNFMRMACLWITLTIRANHFRAAQAVILKLLSVKLTVYNFLVSQRSRFVGLKSSVHLWI